MAGRRSPVPGRRKMIRPWWPDLGAGLAVLAVGVAESRLAGLFADGFSPTVFLVVLGTAAAIAAVRHRPAAALALVWLTLALQLHAPTANTLPAPLMLTQVFVLGVVFGVARWGRPA